MTRMGPLHFHHLTYERLGHENVDDLMSLCGICHAAWHLMKDKARPHKVLQKRWRTYARSNGLKMLWKTDPMKHAFELAKFFGLLDHEFTKRILNP